MIEICLAISMHFAVGDGWNDKHPCARYVADNFTVGAYLNSENSVSAYVSHTFEYDKWFAEVGAVTGYSGADIAPMMRVGYEINDRVSLFASPAYVDGKMGAVIGIDLTLVGF